MTLLKFKKLFFAYKQNLWYTAAGKFAGYLNVLVLNSYLVYLEHASFNKRKDYSNLIASGWRRIKAKYGRDLDSCFLMMVQ